MKALLVAVCMAMFAPVALAATEEDCAQDKDPDLGLKACTVRIERSEDLAHAYDNRGIAYAHKGDLDHAFADEKKAVELGTAKGN